VKGKQKADLREKVSFEKKKKKKKENSKGEGPKGIRPREGGKAKERGVIPVKERGGHLRCRGKKGECKWGGPICGRERGRNPVLQGGVFKNEGGKKIPFAHRP